MIFIKNLIKESTTKLSIAEKEDFHVLNMEVKIGDGEVTNEELMKTVSDEIIDGVKKSLSYIKRIRKDENDTDNCVNILDNKPTEVGFFVTGKRVAIEKTISDDNPCTVVNIVGDATTTAYPRDMIVLITKPVVGDNVKQRVICDSRNLFCPVAIKEHEDFNLIYIYTKYSVWNKLKYPVYFVVENVTYEDRKVVERETLFTFKLGATVNKNVTRNRICPVDEKEARDFLTETFKKLKSKRKPQKRNNGKKPYNKEYRNKKGGKKPYNKDGKRYGNGPRKPYNKRTK